MQILTNSSTNCFKGCRRDYHLGYNLGLRPEKEARPLLRGDALHRGTECVDKGGDLDEFVARLRETYPADLIDDREKVIAMVYGHRWRWQDDQFDEVIASEISFDIPIINPETGKPTPNFSCAGKIDVIARYHGELCVIDRKTTNDSVLPESDYWKRIRLDQQFTRYIYAARTLGYEVTTAWLDVLHTPGLSRQMTTPEDKRKLKKDGTPYASTRLEDETPDAYCKRLIEDMQERPDFYFRRAEVPRVQADIDLWLQEQWQEQKTIREAQNKGWHFRTPQACQAYGRCRFLDICHDEIDLAFGPPPGFVVLKNIHPELGEPTDANCATETNAVA